MLALASHSIGPWSPESVWPGAHNTITIGTDGSLPAGTRPSGDLHGGSNLAGSHADGSVTFTSDGNPLGTVGVSSGQATFTTSGLSAGDDTIAATCNETQTRTFWAANATLTQTMNTAGVQGFTDPELNPVMTW